MTNAHTNIQTLVYPVNYKCELFRTTCFCLTGDGIKTVHHDIAFCLFLQVVVEALAVPKITKEMNTNMQNIPVLNYSSQLLHK